jgi:hypothetical protein
MIMMDEHGERGKVHHEKAFITELCQGKEVISYAICGPNTCFACCIFWLQISFPVLFVIILLRGVSSFGDSQLMMFS